MRSFVFTYATLFGLIDTKTYHPTWRDLDSHPLPQWYDAAKIGILIHWGVYSVPGYPIPGEKYKGSEMLWKRWLAHEPGVEEFLDERFGKKRHIRYQDLAPKFTAKFFDPDEWTDLFVKSGIKYVVLTAKHHDGFTLFPSKKSVGWNSVQNGPRKDLVCAVSKAVKRRGLKFGVFYSFYELYYELFLKGHAKPSKTYPYKTVFPEIKQLVKEYEPSIFWANGNFYGNDTYWRSRNILAWIYNKSPVKKEIVVNDRWGGESCVHGDIYTCGKLSSIYLMNHKWENALTLDKESWGYRQGLKDENVLSTRQLISAVIKTVTYGGNVLINIGPTHEGVIPKIFRDRLLGLGKWLSINGQAIYGTSPWYYQQESPEQKVWFTCYKATYDSERPVGRPDSHEVVLVVYAILTHWPKNDILKINAHYLRDVSEIYMLRGPRNNTSLRWHIVDDVLTVYFPDRRQVEYSSYGVTLSMRNRLPE